jgi:kumamolisin
MGDHTLGNAGRVRRQVTLAAVAVLLLSACADAQVVADDPILIGGPLGRFLTESTDLGSANGHRAELTVALRDSAQPLSLIAWAGHHGLSVRWRPGDDWAYVNGSAEDLGSAFGVPVNDYRSHDGQVFYAARQQPGIPLPVRADVAQLGRILSYNPIHALLPPTIPLDVPDGGLTPTELLTTYNGSRLRTTGRGQTIVFFEIDGGNQKDYDKYTRTFHLPPLTPIVIGDNLKSQGETSMDLQVVHALAPDARKVIINLAAKADSYQQGYQQLADAMELADRRYPGAIWSLSFGMGCDLIDEAADVAPVGAAVARAEAHGTSVFVSSGDTGGYECKGYGRFGQDDFYDPPVETDIGLSTLASLPEVTDVGGTSLSTDARGAWVTEEGWADYPLTQGTGGGISNVFQRPDWQRAVVLAQDPSAAHPSIPTVATQRLTPDVSADADSSSGVAFFLDGDQYRGGGTSQSAPIWAALTALMNQYLISNGGRPLGDLNPLLYHVATSGSRPAFHDVTTGGNAAYESGPGFDLATGLGTPDAKNLADDVLDIQKGRR